MEGYRSIFSFYKEGKCEDFIKKLRVYNVSEVIFYGYECDELNSCDLKEKKIMTNTCLYKVP